MPTPAWRASEEGTPPLRVGVLSPFCVQPPARPAVWAALASRGRLCSLTPWNRTVVAKGPLGYLTLLIFPQRGLWSSPICACGPAQEPTGSAVPWSPTHSPPKTHRSASGMWGLPCVGHLPQFPHLGMWSVFVSPCGECRQGSVWTLQSHPPAGGHASPTDIPVFLQEMLGPRAVPGVRASDAARLELGQASACGLGEVAVAFAPADYRAS